MVPECANAIRTDARYETKCGALGRGLAACDGGSGERRPLGPIGYEQVFDAPAQHCPVRSRCRYFTDRSRLDVLTDRLWPVACVHRMAPVRQHEQHVERDAAVALHSGGSGWHARDRQSARFRSFGEQAFDLTRRHVALDRVTFDHGGVAASERIRHAEPRAVSFRILDVLGLHTEAVGPQMVNPRAATPSGSILVDGHGLRGIRRERREHECRSEQSRA